MVVLLEIYTSFASSLIPRPTQKVETGSGVLSDIVTWDRAYYIKNAII